jgi:TolA-binding protein
MTRSLVIAVAMVVTGAVTVAAAGGEYLLYAPQQVESPRIPDNTADGILVKSITINRGDTLTKLSKRYSGKGTYFPQILLFNSIKNPDLIYADKKLLVPVTRRNAIDAHPAAKACVKRTRPSTGVKRVRRVKPSAAIKRAKPSAGVPHADRILSRAPARDNRQQFEQKLFDRGMAAFNSGNFREALDHFDELLKTAPESPLAADATLYRAECYMKLSGSE